MHLKEYDSNMFKNNDMPISEVSYADLCKAGFFERKQAKLTIIWNEKISKNKQILILKKLYPELNKLSTVETYKIMKENEKKWQFAEMGYGFAVDFLHKAEKAGLKILLEEKEISDSTELC